MTTMFRRLATTFFMSTLLYSCHSVVYLTNPRPQLCDINTAFVPSSARRPHQAAVPPCAEPIAGEDGVLECSHGHRSASWRERKASQLITQ
jgi:hypothetical protein